MEEDHSGARILVNSCAIKSFADALYLPEAAAPHPVVGVEEVADATEQLQERLEQAAAVACRGMRQSHRQAAHPAVEEEEVADAKEQLQEQFPEKLQERRSHHTNHSHSYHDFAATAERMNHHTHGRDFAAARVPHQTLAAVGAAKACSHPCLVRPQSDEELRR